MAETREPSHPPSEPQPTPLRTRSSDGIADGDRPVRIQLFVALLLGLVLVATGLYLWRRPRAVAEASAGESSGDGGALSLAISGDAGVLAAVAQLDAGATTLTVGEARIVSCHDKGSKKTAPADCDHLADFEQAFAKAIEQSASCVPASAGGGTIEYLADVSFARKRNPFSVTLPKENRSLRNNKALAACKTAVAHAMKDVAIESMAHEHQRYRVAIVATYPGPNKGDKTEKGGGKSGDGADKNDKK